MTTSGTVNEMYTWMDEMAHNILSLILMRQSQR